MATTKKKVMIVQTGGVGGQKPGMLENLIGLGLGRIGKRSEIEDTPATRGMLQRVRHLVSIEEGKKK